MATFNTPDPYNGFKQDDQRRRALKVHAICRAVSDVGKALAYAAIFCAASGTLPKAALVWLRHIL